MKKLIILLMLGVGFNVYAGDKIPGFVYGDVKSVLDAAREKKQVVMIDFYTAWCGPCKLLEKNVYRSAAFLPVTEKMVCYKIDAEKGEGIELAKKYNITGYPSVVFMYADGKEIERKVGYNEDIEGYIADLMRIAEAKDVLPVWVAEYNANKNLTLGEKIVRYYLSVDPRSAEPFYTELMAMPGMSDEQSAALKQQHAYRGLDYGLESAAKEADEIIRTSKVEDDYDLISLAFNYAFYLTRRNQKEKAWETANALYAKLDAEKRQSYAENFMEIKYRSGQTDKSEDETRLRGIDLGDANGVSEAVKIHIKWKEKDRAENVLKTWLSSYGTNASLDDMNNVGWTAFEVKIMMREFAAAMIKTWDETVLEYQDAYKADTIANLCEAVGDKANAVRFGQLAVNMIPERSRMRKEFEGNLKRYQAMP